MTSLTATLPEALLTNALEAVKSSLSIVVAAPVILLPPLSSTYFFVAACKSAVGAPDNVTAPVNVPPASGIFASNCVWTLLDTPSIKFNSAAVAVTRVLFKYNPLSVPLCPLILRLLPVAVVTSPVKSAPANAAFVAIEFVTVVEKLASSFNADANSCIVSNAVDDPFARK